MEENPQVENPSDAAAVTRRVEKVAAAPSLKKIAVACSAGIDLRGNTLGSILQQARICLRDEMEGAARSARQRRFASAISPARRKLEI